MPQVNSEPKFKTQYNASETTFQGVPISKYSNAERRHLFIYHYNVAPEVIFEDLVRLKGMEGVRWDDNGTGIEGPGKGTIRWVSLAGGEIREEIMEYDPPKSTFKFKLKNHIAAVTVESDGAAGSLVTWRIYYDYTMNPLTLLKKPIFNTAIPQVLDGLVKTHGGTRLQPE
jgi:hypothetical protein